MIPLYPQQLPQPTTPAVSTQSSWSLTRTFYYLIRALFNRTGGNSGIPITVGNNLAAAGATQGTATVLSNDWNEVLSGAGGVALADLQPGQQMVVYNGTGGSIEVYPPSGGQINALAVNAGFSLGNGKTQIFRCAEQLSTGAPFFRTVALG